MKTKDLLIVALLPLALLLIPVTGSLTLEGWNWTGSDYFIAWVVFSIATFIYRFLAARPFATFAYKAGVALAVLAGFLVFWITAAVQIIGDENPGNLLYLLTILGGLLGVCVARFKPVGLARVAFSMAAALILIPAASFLLWPVDFNPGYAKVQILSSGFAAMFIASGLLLRHAARQSAIEA